MKSELSEQTTNKSTVLSLKNFLIVLVVLVVLAVGFFAFTGPLTQERLEDFTQNPASALEGKTSDLNRPAGPFAPKIGAGKPGETVTVSAESIGGGVAGSAKLETTPAGEPRYTYDVNSDEELQVVLAALFFHGKYLFPDADTITVTVNFPDKPSKTFAIPANTVNETKEEHTNFTEFYENVTAN